MKDKVIYYKSFDEEHSNIKRKTIDIDQNYKYINKNLIWKFISLVVYRMIIYPFAFLYSKIKFRIKIANKACMKEYKKGCYFLYGNHTQVPGDGFFPNLISYPKRNYVIVNSENVSLKGTKNLMMMIGAFPLPSTIGGLKAFTNALDTRCNQKAAITIYPEAHIWPYYTGIRPFSSDSFRYPLKYDAPTFAFTITYKKRKHSKKPNIVIYVDGPFFANKELSIKEQKEDLRNKVYQAMKERAKSSDCEYIKYIKEGEV